VLFFPKNNTVGIKGPDTPSNFLLALKSLCVRSTQQEDQVLGFFGCVPQWQRTCYMFLSKDLGRHLLWSR